VKSGIVQHSFVRAVAKAGAGSADSAKVRAQPQVVEDVVVAAGAGGTLPSALGSLGRWSSRIPEALVLPGPLHEDTLPSAGRRGEGRGPPTSGVGRPRPWGRPWLLRR
jgi:hypothetical protein